MEIVRKIKDKSLEYVLGATMVIQSGASQISSALPDYHIFSDPYREIVNNACMPGRLTLAPFLALTSVVVSYPYILKGISKAAKSFRRKLKYSA